MTSLAGLYAHRVLQSQQRVHSHALIARELSDYLLRWSDRAAVDTHVFKLATPRLALYSMRYGDEVQILPQAYDGFLLVHYARSGAVEIDSDGERHHLDTGQVLISNPRRNVSLRWSAGCEQVILRVPHELVAQALVPGGAQGGEPGHPSAAPRPAPPWLQVPARMLQPLQAQLWQTQLDAFCAYAHGAQAQPELMPWLEQVERTMAHFVGLQLGAPAAPRVAMPGAGGLPGTPAAPAPRDLRRRERLLAHVDAHLHQPLTLESLAGAVALSPRQFSDWTQRQFGLPPMAWLRRHRLERARQRLLGHPEDEVTEVALAHGFAHLGRFSQYYKEAYAELPRDTRRRATAGGG